MITGCKQWRGDMAKNRRPRLQRIIRLGEPTGGQQQHSIALAEWSSTLRKLPQAETIDV